MAMQDKVFTLLVKKLSGELSLTERFKVFLILAFNPEARKEFKRLKAVWHRLDYENPHILDFKYVPSTNITGYIKLAIAASIVLFLGLYSLLHPKTYLINNNFGDIKTIKLPDNSIVTLDTGATLYYQVSKIKGFNREVRISGRAFFKVAKAQGKSFTVHTSSFDIKVLGTEFNVCSSPDFSEVTLVEGKIKLCDFKGMDTAIIIKPNYTALYIPRQKSLSIRQTNPNIQTFWMNERIEFQDFKLQDIAKILEIYYGKTIVFDDSLLKYKKIGGSAPTDNYLLIVKALAYITHSDYQIIGDTIYIKHKKH